MKSVLSKIACLAVIVVLSLSLCGCAVMDFLHGNITLKQLIEGFIPVEDQSKYTVSSFVLPEGETIKRISINWVAGSVKIQKGDTAAASELGAASLTEDERMRWYFEDGTLLIRYSANNVNLDGRKALKELTVTLPEGMNNITVDSVSADVTITDMSARELSIDSVSGGIYVEGSYASLSLESVSGDIYADGTFETVELDSVSSNFTLRCKSSPASIKAHSVSGNLALALPLKSAFSITVETVSGSFKSDFKTTVNNNTYTSDIGGASFTFSSVSGGVRITAY